MQVCQRRGQKLDHHRVRWQPPACSLFRQYLQRNENTAVHQLHTTRGYLGQGLIRQTVRFLVRDQPFRRQLRRIGCRRTGGRGSPAGSYSTFFWPLVANLPCSEINFGP
eukprot:132281-Amphidinium_carterae.1